MRIRNDAVVNEYGQIRVSCCGGMNWWGQSMSNLPRGRGVAERRMYRRCQQRLAKSTLRCCTERTIPVLGLQTIEPPM